MARRLAHVVAECRYAERRMTALRLSPDSYLMGSNGAPDTFGEFLFRTSGPLLHEPSADRRGTGTHPVS